MGSQTGPPVNLETWLFVVGLAVLAVFGFLVWLRWWLDAGKREARRAREALMAEDQRRYAVEQSWVDSDSWPLTHYDVYPIDWELTQDLARLKAMGYSIEWQEHVLEGVAVTYSLTPAYEEGVLRGRRRGRKGA